MKMKRFLAITLILALGLVMLTSCGSTKMTMGTGGSSGTYYGFGSV